jgi:alpha-galactosidase
MWALMAAPLIAGNDLREMDAETLAILTAPEVIAINQDPLGVQGRQISALASNNKPEIWVKKLSGVDTYAVALLNRAELTQEITVQWSDIGLPAGPAAVRDLWERADKGVFTGSYTATVPAHGVLLVKIVSAAEASTTATPKR